MLRLIVVVLALGLAHGKWDIIAKNICSTDAGVCFSSETVGYTAGDANGAGPEIFKTTDGGQTWNALNVSFGIDLLVLACAASGNSAVVTSIFGEVWTSSGGDSWKHSLGGGMSQSAHKFDDDTTGTKFGVTGTFKGAQGVAVSKNSGMYLNDFSAGLFTEARYGAFTSDNVWYVAAGQWPSQNTAAEPKRRSVFQDAKGKFPLSYTRPENLQDDGYMAQITVTKDAGKTWTTVFAQNGTFYFNGIACQPGNPEMCCAVGESDSASAPGARIYCSSTASTPGSWNRTFFSPYTSKEGFSLMEIQYAGPNEIWAAGGELAAIAPSAWFLRSVDNGQTWNLAQPPIFGSMVLDLDMVSENVGYAALDNIITQESSIAKYTK